jgi:hypothetical protein
VKRRPALVADGAGEASVADQPGHMQVLHHDHRLGFRQRRGGLVKRVEPLVADLPVAARQRQRCLGPVAGALLLAADRPRTVAQGAQVTPQRLGAIDRRAVGADREGVDAPVDADHRPGNRGRVGSSHLDGQRAVPAVGLPPAGRRQDSPAPLRELAGRLLRGDTTEPWQHHRVGLHLDGAGQPEPVGAAAPLLPPGQSHPPAGLPALPEHLVGAVEVAQRLLWCALGHLIEPAIARRALEVVEQPVQLDAAQGLTPPLEGLAAHR